MGKKVVIQRKGQTMKEGTIGKWLKKDGDFVKDCMTMNCEEVPELFEKYNIL